MRPGSQLRDRLVPPMPGSVLWGWAGPLLVTALGAFLRFNQLGQPRAVLFDETYYVPDAYGILKHGVEIDHVSNVNTLLAQGSTQILKGTKGEYVVHPPLGKMFIAVGEWLFGLTPFGWRFPGAVGGAPSPLMTAPKTRRRSRSRLCAWPPGPLQAPGPPWSGPGTWAPAGPPGSAPAGAACCATTRRGCRCGSPWCRPLSMSRRGPAGS